MSDAAASMGSRTSGAASRRSLSPGEDELLSDDGPGDVTAEEELPALPVDEQEPEPQGLPEEAEASTDEEAEEIDATEAARTLGRKRPRRSIRASSPELGSEAVEAEQGNAESEPEPEPDLEPEPEPEPEPRARQRRARPRAASPAVQNQPAANSKSKQKLKPKPKPKTRKTGASTKRRESGGGDKDDDDDAIEITVQRFANNKKRAGPDGDDEGLDPLQSEIPFANRAGESVVDVLAQVCDEVMAATLAQYQQLADEADSAAAKKECRIKMRAIEAYREELGSRLLQHVREEPPPIGPPSGLETSRGLRPTS